MTTLTATWNRLYGVLGRISMYRLAVLALAAIVLVAVVLSLFGEVMPSTAEILVTLAVLAIVGGAVDAVFHRILHRPWRWEASVITSLVLVLVVRPSVEPLPLVGIALAALAAAASKYLLAWRGRHIFNPAALGATVLVVAGIFVPELGSVAWWVGTPALFVPVLVFGLIAVSRTEKVRIVAIFFVVAVVVSFVRVAIQASTAGLPWDPAMTLSQLVLAFPFLFLGMFMLSEPLTLPPRRWQQICVAVVVGVLAGWPIGVGAISLGQERALLIGNLIAFAFAVRTAVRLTLVERRELTPSVRELVFHSERGMAFLPGQYLELEVAHPHPDARGTRREFSIVSAPSELPTVRIALRESAGSVSSYKRALATVEPGEQLPVTGVWGDFVLPRATQAPVLMVAAGIGVTPFVSQLRQLTYAGAERDVTFIYVASGAEELAFREDLERSGVPVIVFTRDEPVGLPEHWRWAGGARLDAASLVEYVPDLVRRHAFVSGPPRLIADLAPAFDKAASLTTDAFSGY